MIDFNVRNYKLIMTCLFFQTSLAGGDVTVALLLTVTTNTLGVVTVPLMATWLVSVKNVKIDEVSLLVKLLCTVLVPLIVSLQSCFIFIMYIVNFEH